MVTKIYSCPVHGEFEHDIGMNEELKECPHYGTAPSNITISEVDAVKKCGQPVKRVFKPTGYSWRTDGFAGSGFSVPSYK